jgi:starch phosphorylase
MTAFSLRLAEGANAVSQLHAITANATWQSIAPRGILGITNGVHTPTWLGPTIRRLYEGRGVDLDRLDDEAEQRAFWEHLGAVSDERLWAAHQHEKRELAHFARRRLLVQFSRHGEAPEALEALARVLDPDILTIGFARRFATYKRAALLFRDEQRLARILSDADRPVQVVLAGKAHPADRPGQQVIQHIFALSRSPALQGRVFMLEDYDMRVARFLVGGVDVWLNNPRRPMEASGTSGMKAAVNGIPSLSILDGWWDEGFNGHNGWAIGGREAIGDDEAQDRADADELYRLLEETIVPLFYDTGENGVPAGWVDVMRASIEAAIWPFSTARMVMEYVDELYRPAVRAVEPAPV